MECVEISGKCFAEEALLENNLELSDLLHIVEAIPQLIEDLEQGRKSKLWDKLEEEVFEIKCEETKRMKLFERIPDEFFSI